jgi:hypothetical protein
VKKQLAVLAMAASSILAMGTASATTNPFADGLIMESSYGSPILVADTYVHGHTRSDGTYVQGHMRSDSNSTQRDNWSSTGNTNPYTGQQGHRTPRW